MRFGRVRLSFQRLAKHFDQENERTENDMRVDEYQDFCYLPSAKKSVAVGFFGDIK